MTLRSSRTFPGRITLQYCHCRRHASHVLPQLKISLGQKSLRQVPDVLRPLSWRRQTDQELIEAVEEILSEAAGLHLIRQAHITSRDDAQVNR